MSTRQFASAVLRRHYSIRTRSSSELSTALQQRFFTWRSARAFASAQPNTKQTSTTTESIPSGSGSSNVSASAPSERSASSAPDEPPNKPTGGSEDPSKPGALGGFMRGLIGGQSVAVEDAFVAEAKQQGVDLPPPPPQRHATLVPVRRRRRREDENESASQTIRDRIFSRFAGSSFMKNAFEAQQRIRDAVDESDNPIINMFRNLYDRIFAENEMGMVVREIREEDPQFRVSEFLHQLESDLIPTILGAYLKGDRDTLSKMCTQDAYAMLNASIRERETEGIVMDTNVLDIGDVELTAARLLEDSPVLIVTFYVHQVNCVRDNAAQVVEGREDDIRAVYYAWALVREAEFEDPSPSGGGLGADQPHSEGKDAQSESDSDSEKKDRKQGPKPWKLMEMVIRAAHSTI